jgi:hypothetical protein
MVHRPKFDGASMPRFRDKLIALDHSQNCRNSPEIEDDMVTGCVQAGSSRVAGTNASLCWSAPTAPRKFGVSWIRALDTQHRGAGRKNEVASAPDSSLVLECFELSQNHFT